jgi:hypothetical protein
MDEERPAAEKQGLQRGCEATGTAEPDNAGHHLHSFHQSAGASRSGAFSLPAWNCRSVEGFNTYRIQGTVLVFRHAIFGGENEIQGNVSG